MTEPLDHELASRLRAAFDEAPVQPPTPEQRDAVLARMMAVHRPSPRRWWLLPLAAALVALVSVALLTRRTEATTAPRVVTTSAGERTNLEVPALGRFVVEPSSRVSIAPNGEVVVSQGAVAAEAVGVAPLVVECEAVRASGRGRFVVEARRGCDGRARVTAVQGRVELVVAGATVTLEQGGVWPMCEALVEPAVPPTAEAPAPERMPRPERPTVRAPVAKAEVAPTPSAGPSPLSRQNALLARATTLHGAQRLPEAVATLEELLREFPDGALAETAMVQRLRWLVAANDDGSRRAAAEYLAKFPRGFARAEAELALKGASR